MDQRRDIFLARALEAMDLAAKASNRTARAQWLKLAEAYRELAWRELAGRPPFSVN
jgi:hypothetical protein